jgi:dTDP-4-amino-4,6-dideoxygalactose transaminase
MKEKIWVTRSSMPDFDEYMDMIKPLWESHRLTNMGKYHKQLECELKEYLGVSQVSLMANGHMALELTLQAMGFPEGAEVITTPFTFISTTHAIIRNRLTPVFCDIKLSDYTIDENRIENLITEKTVAILPVHVYGNICNVDKIQEIAEKYSLKVIYDAAHAFGEQVNGIGIGNFGDASVFSFHATKVFNTVEGGAVSFHENNLYRKLYNLKNFGIRSEEIVAEVGCNAKMNEFSAAMGLCNLKRIQENISIRKTLVQYYMKTLGTLSGVKLCEHDEENVTYSYGYFPILFQPEVYGSKMRDFIYDRLKENEIYSRKYFYPITADAACFKNKYKNLSLECARYAGDNILVLPLYPELACTKIDEIVEHIKDCLE